MAKHVLINYVYTVPIYVHRINDQNCSTAFPVKSAHIVLQASCSESVKWRDIALPSQSSLKFMNLKELTSTLYRQDL